MSNIISQSQFVWLSDFLYQSAGFRVTNDKIYLIDARLTPIARKYGIMTIDELVEKAKKEPTSVLRDGFSQSPVRDDIIDAMTTNETSFFRDGKPFDVMEKILIPDLLKRNPVRKTLRIWSAAASTGQEAYSIAIVLARMQALANVNREIIGTDISSQVIERAKTGSYTQFEVQRGLPTRDLITHFTKVGTDFVVKPTLKKDVKFMIGNILSPPATLGQFDLVFCRNLLIYFDAEVKRRAVAEIVRRMHSGAYLIVGGSESIAGMSPSLKTLPDYHAVYQKI